MDISEKMLRHYLGAATLNYFDNEDLPPDDVSGYHPYVMAMKREAEAHGDVDKLRLGFEYLLTNPNEDLERFAGDRYPFDSEEIRTIVQYAYQIIWPEKSLPTTTPSEVKLIRT